MKIFRISLAGVALIAACVLPVESHSEPSTEYRPESFEKYQSGGWYVSSPMTAEEIEQSALEQLKEFYRGSNTRKDIPMVPFGFANYKWNEFKSKVQQGDEIRKISAPKEYWQRLEGWEGYVLVRQGIVVWKMMTLIN